MITTAIDTIIEELNDGQGYFLDLKFDKFELELVRSLVEAQWIKNLKRYTPKYVEQFVERGIQNYHESSYLVDHASIWPKANRILSQDAVNLIRSTSLFKLLEDAFGNFEISDEENIGREEIYWRLVRPNQLSDMGPLHADAWFWELGHGVTPIGVKRVKVWVAIYCEPGLNGLRVVPHSQKKEWKYHGEYRDGFSKPQIDEDEAKFSIQLIHTKPGSAVVFNDKLLHGGALNRGEYTRVSLEFTMFIKNN